MEGFIERSMDGTGRLIISDYLPERRYRTILYTE
jgi:hypothetical protein